MLLIFSQSSTSITFLNTQENKTAYSSLNKFQVQSIEKRINCRFYMSSVVQKTAIRGRFLDIQNTVSQATQILDQTRYIEDGLLISEQGKIIWFGDWEAGQSQLSNDMSVDHYPEQLIVPGFIDTHIHFPQTEMVGAYGEQL